MVDAVFKFVHGSSLECAHVNCMNRAEGNPLTHHPNLDEALTRHQ